MKAIITLVTLTLITVAASADYSIGKVQYSACGKNTVMPNTYSTRFGYVDSMCQVFVQGAAFKTPLYSATFVSSYGERTTYIYSQTAAKQTNYQVFAVDLQIEGTVAANGLFNRLYFVRAPGISTISVFFNSQKTISAIHGNLKLLGDGTIFYPLSLRAFTPVANTL